MKNILSDHLIESIPMCSLIPMENHLSPLSLINPNQPFRKIQTHNLHSLFFKSIIPSSITWSCHKWNLCLPLLINHYPIRDQHLVWERHECFPYCLLNMEGNQSIFLYLLIWKSLEVNLHLFLLINKLTFHEWIFKRKQNHSFGELFYKNQFLRLQL